MGRARPESMSMVEPEGIHEGDAASGGFMLEQRKQVQKMEQQERASSKWWREHAVPRPQPVALPVTSPD